MEGPLPTRAGSIRIGVQRCCVGGYLQCASLTTASAKARRAEGGLLEWVAGADGADWAACASFTARASPASVLAGRITPTTGAGGGNVHVRE